MGDAAARQRCDETGALLICDEVQTGRGRTGKMWGYQQLEVEPDVFTTAKARGGGVPIGAMLCKSRADVFKPGDHASTYGGNPLASAAGNAVLDAFEKRNVIDNARAPAAPAPPTRTRTPTPAAPRARPRAAARVSESFARETCESAIERR